MDLQGRLTAFAMLGAGWVMWLLVLLSVVCVTIVLERAYVLLSSRDDYQSLRDDFLALLKKNDIAGAIARLAKSRSFEARVVTAGLESHAAGPASAEERMMERNLAFLGTVGNNAPFVGLLGTVIGIIRSFQELNQSQGQVSAGLMSEIGEALVATAIGLLVALPAVAAFNTFQRIIKTRATRADAMGREVLAFMKSKKRSHAAPAE
jgi:biopolymer transport protein ExbB